jgi:tetratricopeptide (TPR) repeat protein
MGKRSNTSHGDAYGEKYEPAGGDRSLAAQLEAVRLLLDQGRSSEAESKLRALIKAARHDVLLLSRARAALSEAQMMEGRFTDALASIQMYESADVRRPLDAATDIHLRAQLGLAFNYTGDYPKAIALLNAALKDAPEHGADEQRGAIYSALARVYRSISEYPIARDYSQRSLDHYRRTGNWRGLAEAYIGLSLVYILQGNHESCLVLSEQAVKLIGDHHAPFLLGKIYANMAGACWFLKRPHDGIRHLEKAINYYERTEHKANAALGYNNLGINLTLVGRWDRAHESLKRALELAFEVDERGAQVPMILDSLGELRMLRGELEDAQSLLERAVKLADENGNKWYTWQAMRTLGHCLLVTGDVERALAEGERAFTLAEGIGDRQAICESSLLLAEAHLRRGETGTCAELLQKVTELIEDSVGDLALAGEAQRIAGLLAMRQENPLLASHHFGRSVSIFELLGDRYRSARAHFDLGRAHASVQPERAAEPLTSAVRIFRELGARLDLSLAEEALAALGYELSPPRPAESPTRSQLSILRLVEAVTSRELLLRELASLMRQEVGAAQVLVLEAGEDARYRVAGEQGYAPDEGARVLAALSGAASDEETERLASAHGGTVIRLRVANAAPASLFISPRAYPASVTLLGAASSAAVPQNVPLAAAVEDLERGMIADALRRHNGNVTRAARELGLTRRGLQLKLGRYQIAATA